MTEHEVLVAARNLIERDGWGRGNDSSIGRGGYCPLGAMGKVLGIPERCTAAGCTVHYGLLEKEPVVRVFAEVLPTDGDPLYAVYAWNDCVATTKAEVLAAFDKAIAATAPEPDPSLTTDPKQPDPEPDLPVAAEALA